MLDVRCTEHLESVRKYADSLGPEVREQLEAKLTYLETYRGNECVCEVFKDFAPYSFGLRMCWKDPRTDEWTLMWNGGLIHHAARSNGAGFPELSVTLNPQDRPHWEVHT